MCIICAIDFIQIYFLFDYIIAPHFNVQPTISQSTRKFYVCNSRCKKDHRYTRALLFSIRNYYSIILDAKKRMLDSSFFCDAGRYAYNKHTYVSGVCWNIDRSGSKKPYHVENFILKFMLWAHVVTLHLKHILQKDKEKRWLQPIEVNKLSHRM